MGKKSKRLHADIYIYVYIAYIRIYV